MGAVEAVSKMFGVWFGSRSHSNFEEAGVLKKAIEPRPIPQFYVSKSGADI